VRVRRGDPHRQRPLRASDVEDGAVVAPREFGGHGLRRPLAEPRHRLDETLQARGVGVEFAEEVAAALRLVLRLAGAQPLRQRTPVRVEAGVGHLQHPAHIARLAPVEEQVGRRRVAVAAVLVPVEHAERDQGVEEVARAALVQAEAGRERAGVERAAGGQFGEEAEFDGAEQRLRAPEAQAQLHDRVRCGLFAEPWLDHSLLSFHARGRPAESVAKGRAGEHSIRGWARVDAARRRGRRLGRRSHSRGKPSGRGALCRHRGDPSA
jgi:hypothetical protein